MRNTYISAISYSTATFFRFLSPLVSEISNQPVDSNTLALAVDAIFIWAPVYEIVARNLGTNLCRWQKKLKKKGSADKSVQSELSERDVQGHMFYWYED